MHPQCNLKMRKTNDNVNQTVQVIFLSWHFQDKISNLYQDIQDPPFLSSTEVLTHTEYDTPWGTDGCAEISSITEEGVR